MIRQFVRNILIKEVFNNLLLESPDELKKIKDTYYPNLKISEDSINLIYEALKSNQVLKKTSINWIFLMIKNRVPRVLEDIETIAKNLKVFYAKSSQISSDGNPTMLYKQNGDLVYKNQQQLYDLVSKYIKTEEGGEKNLIKKGEYLESKGMATKIYEDSDFVVFRPDTYEASKELACLTQWCTRFPDMYKRYSGQGPLYIILNKNTLGTDSKNRMIQFHIESKQFKDVNDREISNRRDFMNNLKGLFDKMFPSAIEEFKMVQDGKKDKDELSQSAKESRYIMPSDYWNELDIPCGDLEEKIAKQLGVDCKEVEEGDWGYIVDDETYRVETVEEALEYAIDSMLNSGLEDEYFVNYVIKSKDWSDVYDRDTDIRRAIENEFGEDYEHLYEIFSSELKRSGHEYTESEIENGDFLDDVSYKDFLDALDSYKGDDPVKYYINELGYKVDDLRFIDLEDEARDYFNDPYSDTLAGWVSSYDGTAYYFNHMGKEYIMYRTD